MYPVIINIKWVKPQPKEDIKLIIKDEFMTLFCTKGPARLHESRLHDFKIGRIYIVEKINGIRKLAIVSSPPLIEKINNIDL